MFIAEEEKCDENKYFNVDYYKMVVQSCHVQHKLCVKPTAIFYVPDKCSNSADQVCEFAERVAGSNGINLVPIGGASNVKVTQD